MLRFLRKVVKDIIVFVRGRVPEKVVLGASYITNFAVVVFHILFLNTVSEEIIWIPIVEIIVALQLLLPFFIMMFIPILHYLFILALLAVGTVTDVIRAFPIYYYTLAIVAIINLTKTEFILPSHPAIVKFTLRLKRAFRKAQIPRSREETLFALKISLVHIISIIISAIVLVVKMFLPAIIVLLYSLVLLSLIYFGVGASVLTIRKGKKKQPLTLLFVMRYPLLLTLADKMKKKLHPLCEKAGVLIYELEYVAKYISYMIWYLMALPVMYLVAYTILPFMLFVIVAPLLAVMMAVIYYMPFLIIKSKISSRKNNVEKEYPLFVVYASALTSAGYTLYQVFKDLTYGKGATLLKAFTKEAKYLASLVDRLGYSEIEAFSYYATNHPSPTLMNFILGYLNQRHLGTRIVEYMDTKVNEALDALRRRMESYVENITTLSEVALTVLVLPVLPMVVGFIMQPDMVFNMLLLQMLVVIPGMSLMFYTIANAMQFEFRDTYRFTYVPSVIMGLIGLGVAFLFLSSKLISAVSLIIGFIALGYYVEYLRERRVFGEIEKILPQFFRDLSELKTTMPISKALEEMSKMGYPVSVKRILRRIASLKAQGVRISEQPWLSRSWFWRFTQFLLGKIEETGGGTPELFKTLMLFFMQFNNIMASVRGRLRIYEFVVLMIPVIFGLVTYSTIGIFNTMGEMFSEQGVASALTSSPLMIQIPSLARVFQGIDPMVFTINDILIVEMSFLLGLLGGKIVSGTLRDTRMLGLSLIVAAIVTYIGVQLGQMFLQMPAGMI